jgi:uncharacterized protein DUF4406
MRSVRTSRKGGEMKVYVAGPYSKGDTILNIGNAIRVAEQLSEAGYVPFIPHLTGFWHLVSPHPYEFWMKYDAEWLMDCDAVLRFPGESLGADREVEMARSANIPIFYSVEELCTHYPMNLQS